MIKIVKKIKFSKNEDRMKDFGNIKKAMESFRKSLKNLIVFFFSYKLSY